MNFNIDSFYNLVNQGLVGVKDHGDLVMFKYKNKVFYDNLWHKDPALLESRGIVFNKTSGEVVQLPIQKCFNVGENGTKFPNRDVVCYRKINGFMLASTWMWHGQEILSTTTGSFDSDFQVLGESYLTPYAKWLIIKFPHLTFTFEVCSPIDPHIVQEVPGLYLLTARHKANGIYMDQEHLDTIGAMYGVERPGKEDYNSTVKHEGFMFYHHLTGEPVAKVKTKHYLAKKALMRVGKGQIKVMFGTPKEFRKRLDEEFYNLFDKILDTFTEQQYADLNEQQRRAWIEENIA